MKLIALFRLALDDDRELENWAKNLKFETVRHYGDFEEWRRSGFFSVWVVRFIHALKNASRMLCYRIE